MPYISPVSLRNRLLGHCHGLCRAAPVYTRAPLCTLVARLGAHAQSCSRLGRTTRSCARWYLGYLRKRNRLSCIRVGHRGGGIATTDPLVFGVHGILPRNPIFGARGNPVHRRRPTRSTDHSAPKPRISIMVGASAPSMALGLDRSPIRGPTVVGRISRPPTYPQPQRLSSPGVSSGQMEKPLGSHRLSNCLCRCPNGSSSSPSESRPTTAGRC